MNKNELTGEFKDEQKGMLNDTYLTALTKVQFANQIKNGLGKELKANPNGLKITKKTKYQKLILWLKKIFTKF